MKYIQNFHDKTESEVLAGIGNIDYPVIIGGGNTNEGIKIFIEESAESLHTKLNNANSIEEAFDITYKPYIINGYDQRMTLETSLGFYGNTYNAYATGILSNPPMFYNHCKVSPVVFSSSDTSVATVDSNGVVTVIASGTTIIKVSFAGNDKFLPQEKQYTLTVDIPVVVDPEPDYYLTYNGHKYVDLGLPSGRKWSAYNMGATAVNEYGDEYYWGNTNPCTPSNSTDIYNPDDDWSWTKYNEEDGKYTLEMSDDAARVNWGGNWKIPSNDDFHELENNTTMSFVTNYLGRGADGILFTSKINGNTLFFPLDDNGQWGAVNLLTSELMEESCTYVWHFCKDTLTYGSIELYAGIDPDNPSAYRNYTDAYRPVF